VLESEKSKILALSDIKFTSNLERYLGFHMFHGQITQREFSDVMDSVQFKLTSWKGRLPNKLGSNVLVNSVISAFPTYGMHFSGFSPVYL
ncbi:RNA-directed DNA polymerase (Reverse transcriptase), partial [Trifolium medium]|nr:RNA-directed DNA polymerase (Reverse transcriptase) [Trifolium medium]